MDAPILGIARGRFLNYQRTLLRKLADAYGVEMKIVTYNLHGTDEMIFYVVNSHCKSVVFRNIANISKTFLFSLRFIYDVQSAGIAVYEINELVQPPKFCKLNKDQYQQLMEDSREEWQQLVQQGASWWKPYSAK